jgi:hypothetical protein
MAKLLYIRFFFCLLLVGFGIKIFAQQKTLVQSNNLYFKVEKSFLFFSNPKAPVLIQQDYSFTKSIQQNKRPVFCRMEDNLHKRLNVWILFRAGSDADYRKLIAQPYK